MPIFYLSDLGSIGIVKDADPHTLPPSAWTNGANVRFREGVVEQAAGYLDLLYNENTATRAAGHDETYWIVQASGSGDSYLVTAGTQDDGTCATIARTLEGAYNDCTPADWVGETDKLYYGIKLSGGVFDGTPILASGRGNKVYYLPSPLCGTTFTELRYVGGTRLSAKLKFDVVRPMWQHLFGLGTEVVSSSVDGVARGYYPRLLWFSDAADPGNVPGSWDADNAATLSRSYPDPFASYNGALVDMVQLGQDAVVYQEDACHLARYTGQAPFVVSFNTALHEIGAIATGCVAAVRNQHLVLTESDVVIHNTQQVESILERKLRRWLFSQFDTTNYRNSFVKANFQGNEIWICYPSSGQIYPDMAVVWNYKDNTTTIRELRDKTTFAWFGKQTSGPFGSSYQPTQHTLFMSTLQAGENILRMEYGNKWGTADPSCYVERTGLPIEGDSVSRKLVTRIWPEIDGDGSDVNFYIGDHDRVDDPVHWQGPYAFTPGEDHSIPVRSNGRLHAVKITWCNGATVRISRIGLEYEPVGRY